MIIAPAVVGDVIERNAALFPDKAAVVFEGKRPTFSQFASRVRRLSHALAAGGLKHGERVAILAQNCLEYFETVGTAEMAGFIAVTLNWRLAPPELAQIVEDCTPTVLIFEERFRAQAESLRHQNCIIRFIIIGDATDWAESYEAVVASGAD